MRIGVFDSGIGGEAVAETLRVLLPSAEITSVNDSTHVPYGSRSQDDVLSLTDAAIQPLLLSGVDVIVIACNTATTLAISALRARYPNMKFVGIEPMVKPAAAITTSRTIAVCATPATLGSRRYVELKQLWAADCEVIEPDCTDWAARIETGQAASIDVEQLVASLLQKDVDVIVLACTHYHWLKDRFIAAAGPHVTILEPSDAIARRISDITT